jgi:hypothetical protein
VIIYDDRNAIITNEIKCGVNAKQSPISSIVAQSANTAQDYCKRLLSIAVETDANFTENINAVTQEVDYILYLNFGLKVEYYHKSWSGQSVNPYSSTYVPFIPAGSPGAGRIEEGVIFGRFQNAGWIVNNLPGYDMYHLITGRNMYTSGGGNSGGQALFIPICGSQKPLSISSTEFSGVQQIARTMCHELGHNLSGSPNHDTNCLSCQNTTPSNTMMCTFISGVGGCRGLYFSSTSRTQIENNLLNNSCLSPTPAPIINQVYFNGTPVGTNLNFVSNRAGQMSVNVSDTYPFASTIVNFIPTVSSVNVYGNPGKTISYFVPNNVSSYVMQVKAENRCGTVQKNIPFLYGSGFKVYPNPASKTTFVEFDIDPTNTKNDIFLPNTITLKSEKNEVLKKSNPKQDLIDKKLEDEKRVKWDVSMLPDGIYYIDVIYSDKNTYTVRLLIQK